MSRLTSVSVPIDHPLRKCALGDPTAQIIEVDTEGPCYRDYLTEMRNRQLQAQGYDPDTSPDSPRSGGCCDPPRK